MKEKALLKPLTRPVDIDAALTLAAFHKKKNDRIEAVVNLTVEELFHSQANKLSISVQTSKASGLVLSV